MTPSPISVGSGGVAVALHPKGCATRNRQHKPLLRNRCATLTQPLVEKYEEALRQIPPPGQGCHPALLGVATIGILAGQSPDTIKRDIRAHIPHGKRPVSDREIVDAVNRALMDTEPSQGGRPSRIYRKPPPPKPAFDGPAYRRSLIARSDGAGEADLWEASPIRIDWEPGPQDAVTLLQTLFRPDDYIYAGDTYGLAVAPMEAVLERLASGGAIPPQVSVNTFTGNQHTNKKGDLSYRCDAAVRDYRHALVEFDDMPLPEQFSFWLSVVRDNLLPVVALVYSGGKSIHAWLRVDLPDAEAWDKVVREGMYGPVGRMTLMGADTQCANPSRLSRMPGHLRNGERMQKLLYLNPHQQENDA